jgi:hypothetical protein
MDPGRLSELIDAYGADPRRWPQSERDAAETLLAASQEAQALRAEAAALDALLDLSAAPDPSPELQAAILAGAQPPSGWRRWLADFWPVGPAWQPASAFAAAIVLGVAVGIGAPEIVLPDANDGAIAEVESLAFGPALDLEDGL